MKKDDMGKESLREQYEDVLFKLLMDEFAEKEGQLLTEENERLKNDKEFVLPDGLEARCEKAISNVFAVKHRKKTLHKTEKIISRVAVIVLVCGVVFTTLFSSVSAFRETVYKIFLNEQTIKTDVIITDNNESDNTANPIDVPPGAYLPTTLPDGYALFSYEKNEIQTVAMFMNASGNEIYYYEMKSELVFGVDTEDADNTENIDVNGYDGLVVVKGATISITWFDEKRNILARIKTLDIDKKIVIKIAQSVIEY